MSRVWWELASQNLLPEATTTALPPKKSFTMRNVTREHAFTESRLRARCAAGSRMRATQACRSEVCAAGSRCAPRAVDS